MSTPALNPFQVQVGGNASQFWAGIAGSRDLLLINTSDTDYITVGPKGIVPYGPTGQVIEPLQYLSVPGTQDWSAVTDAADLPVLQVTPGGTISPSALAIASQIAASGLALSIAQQIAAQGLALIGAPRLAYDVGPSGPTIAGQWGATWIGSPGATVSQIETGLSSFESVTGRTITTRKVYYGQSDGTGNVKYFPNALSQDPYLQAAKDRGDRVCVCYRPYFVNDPGHPDDGQGTVADGNALTASINALKAAGLNVVAVLQQECEDHMTAAQYIAMYAYYRPYVKAAAGGCLIVFDSAGHTGSAQWAAYEPPVNKPDIYAVDLYAKSFGAGITLDPLIAMANAAGAAVAVFEAGISVGNEIPPDINTINAYFAHLTSKVTEQLDAGLPWDSVMWYFQPNKNVNNDPAPYVTQIDTLADALTAGSVAPFTIAGGAVKNLPPESKSPVAGYATADGISYDITLTLTAGPASTNPFDTIRLLWYNNDDPNARPVDSEYWTFPLGTNGSTGTVVTGRGPQRGQFLKVQAVNRDSVTMTLTCQLNSTSRAVDHDDWRWDAGSSVALPAFTVNGAAVQLPGGGSYANSLGSVNNVPLAPGGKAAYLISAFAGEVWIKFDQQGASAAAAQIELQIIPQPSSVFGTAPIVHAFIGGTAPPLEELIVLPRAACVVYIANNQSSGTVNVFFEAIARG